MNRDLVRHVICSALSFASVCLYIRLFLGFIILTSGFGKIAHQVSVHFISFIGPVMLEQMLAPHGLALFGRFVAYSQIVIGLCLLTSRLATLGAIMLVPMLSSIFVVTVSMDFKNTPYVVAVMLMMNLLLLLKDWHKLKFIWAESTVALKPMRLSPQWVRADLIGLLGALLVLGSILVFHYAPAYGKSTLRLGVVVLIISGVTRWATRSPLFSRHRS